MLEELERNYLMKAILYVASDECHLSLMHPKVSLYYKNNSQFSILNSQLNHRPSTID